jgi:putative ABC transport system permease protein
MRKAQNIRAGLQVVRAQPTRTTLLALPVAISTAMALATLIVDAGLTARAQAAARSFGTDVISIRPGTQIIAGKSGPVGTLSDEDVPALRGRLRDAVAVEGTRIQDGVPMSAGSRNGVYRVFGVRPPWAGIRDFGAERGEFLSEADVASSARVSVIGQTVARELFAGRDPIGAEILVNQVPFQVKGVLVPKGASPAEGDRDARIVIPISTFYDRLYRRLHLDQIVVQARDSSPETLASLEQQIRPVLREQHHIAGAAPDDFVVRLPDTIAEEARGLSRSVFLLLLGLSAVGALLATLVIGLVTQQGIKVRQGEIGIRRAIGALPGDILQQVAIEGIAVSLLGGLAGLALGVPAAWLLARVQALGMGFTASVVIGPLLLVTLAAMAGVLPARTAAKLDPAAALRVR